MRYLFVLILLAGCARQPLTPEQQAELIVTNFGPVCDKIGFQRDTDPWRNCVLQQYQTALQEASARRAAAVGMYGARPKTCNFVGNTMSCF